MDIFDKIMTLPILNYFEPFYKRNKEILLYLFFGGLTTIVSIGSYVFCNVSLGMNALIANIISWVLAVTFAYVTNRIWVFSSTAQNVLELVKEMLSFFGGRVTTLAVEEIILFVFITLLGWNSIVVKAVAQVIVVLLNYVISKLLVFKS